MRVALTLALLIVLGAPALARADSDAVSVELAGNRDFPKVELLRKRTFARNAAILPHPGPGASISLWLKSGGQQWLLDARVEPSSMGDGPEVQAKLAPLAGALKLRAARDGHAIAWSVDGGQTWRLIFLDGPQPLICFHTPPVNGSPDAPLADPARSRELALEIATTGRHDSSARESDVELFGADYDEHGAAEQWLRRHAQDAAVSSKWTDPEVLKQRKREQQARDFEEAKERMEREAQAKRDFVDQQTAADTKYLESFRNRPVTARDREPLVQLALRASSADLSGTPPARESCARARDALAIMAREVPTRDPMDTLARNRPIPTLLPLAFGGTLCARGEHGLELRGLALRLLGDQPWARDELAKVVSKEPCTDGPLPELEGGAPPEKVRSPGCEAKAALFRIDAKKK